MKRMNLRVIILLLCSIFIFKGFASDLVVESLTERPEDLTANTYAILDLNNNKCALIKLSIPDKAAFEGNVVKSEYKVNEYYIYLSPGTKKLAVKYPGVETLEIDLSDFLDGSGVVSGRTYRLKLSGIPQEIPQLTILLPDNNPDNIDIRTLNTDSILSLFNNYNAQNITKPAVNKPKGPKFIVRPNVSIGIGNALSMQPLIELDSQKSSAMNFGIDFGFNLWYNLKNSLILNLGVGYSSYSLNIDADDFSFNYFAPSSADIDGNTYYRYYDVRNLSQQIKVNYLTIPIYLGYTYNVTKWLGIYLNAGASLGINAGSSLSSVAGQARVYGIYPEYGNLIIDESYMNGFGTTDLAKAQKQSVNVSGFSSALLLGFGFDVKLYGPVWVNAGVRYNVGLGNIFTDSYNGSGSFSSDNAPVTYTVAEGERVNALTDYMKKSSLASLCLNIGIAFKF